MNDTACCNIHLTRPCWHSCKISAAAAISESSSKTIVPRVICSLKRFWNIELSIPRSCESQSHALNTTSNRYRCSSLVNVIVIHANLHNHLGLIHRDLCTQNHSNASKKFHITGGHFSARKQDVWQQDLYSKNKTSVNLIWHKTVVITNRILDCLWDFQDDQLSFFTLLFINFMFASTWKNEQVTRQLLKAG